MAELDFRTVEKKWQDKWNEAKAFEPQSGKPRKFFFTTPYPYASGCLHVGHGRSYTNSDVLVRFKRMNGFNVLWPMAFHITGTPVLAVSAKIKEGDAEAIALYKDYARVYENDEKRVDEIVKSFEDPWNLVNYFSKKIVQDFKRMGYSLDLTRQFTTGDAEYNKFVEWQFTKYKQAGFLKQAAYPILFDLKEKNAAGEDDIKDGDTDPVELQKYVALKSRFEDGFIASATLRPETVFGITNVFANPGAKYAKAKIDGEIVFVSFEALDKLRLQNHKVEKIKELDGSYFIGKNCKTPLDVEIPILPADFVDADNATGFVHSVPAHSVADFVAVEDLKKNKKILEKYQIEKAVARIEPIALIRLKDFGVFPAVEIAAQFKIANANEKHKLEKATQHLYKAEFYGGVMNEKCQQFAGKTVVEAKEEVGDWLLRNNHAFVFYETSRRAISRGGGKIIGAILPDQWFLDFNAPGWKQKAEDCLEQMTIYPDAYRKQFLDVFSWLDKRPCARRRGLGTRLPFARDWIIESLSDSTVYMAFYTVIKKIREHELKPQDLDEEFFDAVLLGRPYAGKLRNKILEEARKEFSYWYPNDQRHTAVAHVTNHLSFFIFAHAGIFPPECWPKTITLNEMVLSEGSKMSKSRGNVVLLDTIAKEYGADLFRLYCAGSADFASTLDFRKKDIEAARKRVNKFYSLASSLVSLSAKKRPSTPLLKWLESRVESAIQKSTLALEEYRLRDYVQLSFHSLLNAFEHFDSRATEEEKRATAPLALRWVRMLAPLMPHACEELWAKAKQKGFISLSEWPQADEKKIDLVAEAGEDFVALVANDVRKIVELIAKKQKVSRAKIIVASKEKQEVAKVLVKTRSSPQEILDETVRALVDKRFFELKENPVLLEIDELAVLKNAKGFLERQLGLEIELESAAKSKEEKAAKAQPLKPALILS